LALNLKESTCSRC